MKRVRIIMILYVMVFLLAVYIKFLYSPPEPEPRSPIFVTFGDNEYVESIVLPENVKEGEFRVFIGSKVDLQSTQFNIDDFFNRENHSFLDRFRLSFKYKSKLYHMRFNGKLDGNSAEISLIAKQDMSLEYLKKVMSIKIENKEEKSEKKTIQRRGDIKRGEEIWKCSLKLGDILTFEFDQPSDMMDVSLNLWKKIDFKPANREIIDFKYKKDKNIEEEINPTYNFLTFDFFEEQVSIQKKERDKTVENGFKIGYVASIEPNLGVYYYVDIIKDKEEPDFFEPAHLTFEHETVPFRLTFPPSENWQDTGDWYVGSPYNSIISATNSITSYEFFRIQAGDEENLSGLKYINYLEGTNQKTLQFTVPRINTQADVFIFRAWHGNQPHELTWTVKARIPDFAHMPPIQPSIMEGKDKELYENFKNGTSDSLIYENRKILIFPQLIGISKQLRYKIYENKIEKISKKYDPNEIDVYTTTKGSGGGTLSLEVLSEGQVMKRLPPNNGASQIKIRRVPDDFIWSYKSFPSLEEINNDTKTVTLDFWVMDYFGEYTDPEYFRIEILRGNKIFESKFISRTEDRNNKSRRIKITGLDNLSDLQARVKMGESPYSGKIIDLTVGELIRIKN